MAPNALGVEDALSLRLLVVQGDHTLGVIPVHFGIVGCAQGICRDRPALESASGVERDRREKQTERASSRAHGLGSLSGCPDGGTGARRSATCAFGVCLRVNR